MASVNSIRSSAAVVAAVLSTLALVSCADPSCPAGSTSVDGRCEPAKSCDPGELLENGECVSESLDGGGDSSIDEADGGGGGSGGAAGTSGGAAGTGGTGGSAGTMADPLCEALDCGEHGACEVVADEAACVCSDGFAGPSCEACEADLVLDGDVCVAPCEASSAPDCGEHGTCEADESDTTCQCMHPYDGDLCDECAEGFALQGDGTCEPDCGECGAHEYCNETLMTPSCECVAGYADNGSGCAWVGDGTTGGIVDGDLEDEGAWSLDRVSFSPTGAATFENATVDGLCRVGTMSQLIKMPSRADAEQLVMDVSFGTTCSSSSADECPGLQVEIGDTAVRLVRGGTTTLATGSICLGDAAFGGHVPLTIRPSLAYLFGQEAHQCGAQWPEVTKVSIRPANANECPTAGAALGTLASKNGWTGAEGSTFSGSQITALNTHVQTVVQAPAEIGLSIHAKAGNAALTIEGLDQTFVLDADDEVVRCLPTWARGSFVRIGFRPLYAGAKVTAFSVVTDPACAPGEFDRGFETVGSSRSWDNFPLASYGIVSDAGAFAGQRVFKASASIDAFGLVRMPVPDDTDAGLAFSARRRVTGTSMRGTYKFDFGPTQTFMTTSTSWGSVDLTCLDPAWFGQLTSVHLNASAQMTSGSGTPVLLLDEVGPILSDACD